MPNRSARSPGRIQPFRPRGVLQEGLLPVSRPQGEDLGRAAQGFSTLARSLGGIADQLAAAEGERAGNVAGNDPGFRPSGRMTIRGRAYDRAATETYLNNLDARLRLDMQSLFEQNRNDPGKLATAFDQLGALYEREHVFPDIAGAFNAQFARMRLPYQNKALDNFEEDRRQRDYGDLLVTINDMQTARSRQLASLDPSDPAAVDVLLGSQEAIDTQYDRAVAQELMTPAQAEAAKIDDRRATAVRFYARQAEELGTPDAIAAFREDVRVAHGKGDLDGIDGDGYELLDAELTRLESRARTEGKTAQTALRKRIDSYVDRVADGLDPPPEEWSTIQIEAGRTPDGAAMTEIARQKLAYAKVIRDRPLADAEAAIGHLRTEAARAGTEEAKAVLDFAEGRLDSEKRRVATDPLGAALGRGLIREISPLVIQSGTDMGSLAAQVAARVAQGEAVADQLGRSPRYLRPDEVTRIREIAAQDIDTATAVAGGLVSGAGSAAPAILRELGDEAPALAQAGAILAAGGSAAAARDAIAGASPPPTGGARPDIGKAARDRIAGTELGKAFVAQPEDGTRTKEAARNIARVRMEAAGVKPESGEAEEIFRQALREATGAMTIGGVQYGGLADYSRGWLSGGRQVLVPSGVKAESFRDVILAIRDGDLGALDVPPVAEDGTPYRARDLHAAIPVAVAGGYRFALGEPGSADPRWIRGADGRPFVLDLKLIAPMLRSRVPGAFLGE